MRSFTVLVLAAGLVAAAAAEKKPSFADWLAATSGSQKAGAQAISPSQGEDYYGEVETVDTCLRAVTKRNCLPSGTPVYSEYGLTCCDAKHYYNKELNQYLNKPVEVGDCQITETPIGTGVAVSEKVLKTATFVAQCSMNEKSDECGHPFCDKMVLTIVGSKYRFTNAIVSSLPADLALESCTIASTPAQLQATAASEYDYEYGHKHYKVVTATVYHGTMTVNSRLHNVKYSDGTFQFVSYIKTADATEATHAEIKDSYVLDPYKVELSFYKPKDY